MLFLGIVLIIILIFLSFLLTKKFGKLIGGKILNIFTIDDEDEK